MLSAAVMPVIPDRLTVRTVLFSLCFGAFGVSWLLRLVEGEARLRLTPAAWALAAFFALALLSYPVGRAHGVTTTEWLRGAIPFVFLGVFLMLPGLKAADRGPLINTLHLACLAWAVKSFLVMTTYWKPLYAGAARRLTMLDFDLILPYGLIGFILTLLNPDPRFARWRVWLLAPFTVLVVGSGYRSMSALCVAAFLFYLLRERSWRRRFAAAGMVVACAWLTTTMLRGGVLPQNLKTTGAQNRADSERSVELRHAWQSFRQSVVVGNGLGYGIPAQAVELRMNREKVGYVHNVWVYMLMDLGVLGLIAYASFVALPLWRAWRRRRRFGPSARACLIAAGVVLVMLMAFTTVEATFRLIQFNLILATLAAVLDGEFNREAGD
jgi:O-antigen ligase